MDASFGIVVTLAPFADSIDCISGLAESVGGSIGFGPSGTAEAVIPIGSSLKGAAISASWGAGVGVEGHAITSYTTVQEFDWPGFVEMVKQWWNGK